jgi:hypothetical protein
MQLKGGYLENAADLSFENDDNFDKYLKNIIL